MSINKCKNDIDMILIAWDRMKYLYQEVRKYSDNPPASDEDLNRFSVFANLTDEEMEQIHGMVKDLRDSIEAL